MAKPRVARLRRRSPRRLLQGDEDAGLPGPRAARQELPGQHGLGAAGRPRHDDDPAAPGSRPARRGRARGCRSRPWAARAARSARRRAGSWLLNDRFPRPVSQDEPHGLAARVVVVPQVSARSSTRARPRPPGRSWLCARGLSAGARPAGRPHRPAPGRRPPARPAGPASAACRMALVTSSLVSSRATSRASLSKPARRLADERPGHADRGRDRLQVRLALGGSGGRRQRRVLAQHRLTAHAHPLRRLPHPPATPTRPRSPFRAPSTHWAAAEHRLTERGHGDACEAGHDGRRPAPARRPSTTYGRQRVRACCLRPPGATRPAVRPPRAANAPGSGCFPGGSVGREDRHHTPEPQGSADALRVRARPQTLQPDLGNASAGSRLPTCVEDRARAWPAARVLRALAAPSTTDRSESMTTTTDRTGHARPPTRRRPAGAPSTSSSRRRSPSPSASSSGPGARSGTPCSRPSPASRPAALHVRRVADARRARRRWSSASAAPPSTSSWSPRSCRRCSASPWGLYVVAYGLVQGAAGELVFALTLYRSWRLPTAVLAGAAAGAAAALLDLAFYYPDWSGRVAADLRRARRRQRGRRRRAAARGCWCAPSPAPGCSRRSRPAPTRPGSDAPSSAPTHHLRRVR